MILRTLPPEEWPRLVGTEAEHAWPLLDPRDAQILVVEDEGKIVGTWTLMHVVHAECLWIAPTHRGTFGVAKRLLRGMREVATRWGMKNVVTGSQSPHVTDLIMRFGGMPMPCESFVLPAQDRSARRKAQKDDRALGRSFHEQLAAQVSEDLHPDDEIHDEKVGHALRVAIEQHEPEKAVEEYNAWAQSAGYQAISYLGTVDGRMRADILTAVVEVDARYTVKVVEGSCQAWEREPLVLRSQQRQEAKCR